MLPHRKLLAAACTSTTPRGDEARFRELDFHHRGRLGCRLDHQKYAYLGDPGGVLAQGQA